MELFTNFQNVPHKSICSDPNFQAATLSSIAALEPPSKFDIA